MILSIVKIPNRRYSLIMSRTSLHHHNCSLARTAQIIGDKWTLMIIRDAFYGFRRFKDFKARLGITQAVLSDRLANLVEHGILDRAASDGQHPEYRLSDKGRDLFPLVIGLVQWGDRWIHEADGPPILIRDRANAQPLSLTLSDSDGNPVDSRDVEVAPGPGANAATLAEFARLARHS
jgi:DNA-binding HxlR family transcriptional regulator